LARIEHCCANIGAETPPSSIKNRFSYFRFAKRQLRMPCLPDVKIIQQDQPNDDKNARRAACAAGPPKVVHHLSSLRNPKNTKIVFRLTLGGSVDDNDRVRSGCGHGR